MSTSDTVRLKMLGLPVIESMEDFAGVTRLSKSIIYQLSTHADEYYKVYEIPKKSGGLRFIAQPGRKLKALQAWILVNILNKLTTSPACKGFEKGTSTYDNANAHIGAIAILTIDIEDFFPSITQRQVFNIFKAVGYNNLVAVVCSRICTHDGKLPQGSPCSPKLANLSVWRMDARLQGYVGKQGINYTRYADDLTFSGMTPGKLAGSFHFIKKIVNNENFNLNSSKTRLNGHLKAKIVTGLVVLNDGVGIGKEKYKLLRAKIHRLTRPSDRENFKLLSEVHGWLAYLNSVDIKRLNKAKKYIKSMKDKYPESLVNEIRWK